MSGYVGRIPAARETSTVLTLGLVRGEPSWNMMHAGSLATEIVTSSQCQHTAHQ